MREGYLIRFQSSAGYVNRPTFGFDHLGSGVWEAVVLASNTRGAQKIIRKYWKDAHSFNVSKLSEI